MFDLFKGTRFKIDYVESKVVVQFPIAQTCMGHGSHDHFAQCVQSLRIDFVASRVDEQCQADDDGGEHDDDHDQEYVTQVEQFCLGTKLKNENES